MSLAITKKIILNTSNDRPNSRIIIKQGSIGTITLIVTINDMGGVLELPTGTTAKVRMLKPDKKQVLNDCEIVGDNVSVEITQQMQAVAGDGLCEVILFNDGKSLTSATFPITIEPNVHNDGNIESTHEYITILNTLAKIEGAGEKADLAYEVAAEAHTIIQSAEIKLNQFTADKDIALTQVTNATQSANTAADLANIKAGLANTATTNANTATTNANSKIIDVETRFQALTTEQQQASEVIDARKGKSSLREKIDEVDSQLAEIENQKVNKNEVTNGLTPKGNLLYANLPSTGNEIGNYYYCADGDGTNPAGNYVWSGTAWYFGGTGDSGYAELTEMIGAYRPNEFDKYNITTGRQLRSTIGMDINSYVVSSNAFYSNQIWQIKQGDVIRFTWAYAQFIVYDVNKQVVEAFGSTGQKEYTITAQSAMWLRYTSASSSENYVDNFMFTINRPLQTQYVAYDLIGIDTVESRNLKMEIEEIKSTDHIPYVVLNFDNQIDSMENNVVKLVLDEYGYPFTFVGWEQPSVFKQLLERGCDIGTYDNSPDILPPSSTINSSDEVDIEAYDNYVYQAKKKQTDIGIFNPTTWCCRKNQYGTALDKAVKKYKYKMARGYQTGDFLNLNIDENFPVLDSRGFYTGQTAGVISVLNNAIGKNAIVVILAHKIVNTIEEDRGYDVLYSDYENMLIHLKTLVDNGSVKVVTFRELYKLLYPIDGYENDYNRLLKTAQYTASV